MYLLIFQSLGKDGGTEMLCVEDLRKDDSVADKAFCATLFWIILRPL
jgi:hypothetical protein